LEQNDLNPFWQKFLQPDQFYSGGLDLNSKIAPSIEKALNTGMSKASYDVNDTEEESKDQPQTDDDAQQ